jgi:hypothetical protein
LLLEKLEIAFDELFVIGRITALKCPNQVATELLGGLLRWKIARALA